MRLLLFIWRRNKEGLVQKTPFPLGTWKQALFAFAEPAVAVRRDEMVNSIADPAGNDFENFHQGPPPT